MDTNLRLITDNKIVIKASTLANNKSQNKVTNIKHGWHATKKGNVHHSWAAYSKAAVVKCSQRHLLHPPGRPPIRPVYADDLFLAELAELFITETSDGPEFRLYIRNR